MAINLNNIGSGFNRSVINDNFQKIENEFINNTLRRDGVLVGEDNSMKIDLDMNNNKILNVLTDINDPLSLVARGAVYVKSEVDSKDTDTLNNAKAYTESYANAGDAATLSAAFNYADAAGNSTKYVQEAVPTTNLRQGNRWYKPSEATTYVYYEDGDSGQWVEEPVQSAEGTLRSELAATDSDVLLGGVKAKYLKPFDSVVSMKAANLSVGQSVSTSGYYAGSVEGAANYIIVAASTGTADGGLFHDLGNGLQAKLIKEGKAKISQFGVTSTSSTTINLTQCRNAFLTGQSVDFDTPLINLPNIARNGEYFPLTPANDHNTFTGPTRFVIQGVLEDYTVLFSAQGCKNVTVVDIHAEDVANKASLMSSQGGLVYCRVPDLVTGDKGTVRFRMVRPALFGGGALFQPIGTVNNTTANQCSIVDGHCEDTYYGINCAQSGDGLKGNIRCIGVKRAYFVYDTEGHDVIVDSEQPDASNAHFLIKSYNPSKGTRDITGTFRISGTTDSNRGRLVFEQQDETTDNSVIEDIRVTLFDNRDVTGESVFFRSYADPITVRATTNSVWRNISIDGKSKGLRFLSKPSKLATIDYKAESEKDVSDLFSYAELVSNTTYDGVLFKDGLRSFKTMTQGVAGTGAGYTLPLSKLVSTSTLNSATVTVKVIAYQGSASSMTNHSTYEVDLLCRYQSGTLTFTQSANRNATFTGASLITASITVDGQDINFASPALGGLQFLVLEFTIR